MCGILYNGTPYYFQKNLQGDVIAIADQNGEVVARYRYDAWGVPTVTMDTTATGIATVNPYRYRGYYYDQDTGLYYLQSRYYDPVVGRFVNADEANFSVTYSILESNLYVYAVNDPISNIDLLGNIAAFLAKKIGSVVVNAVIGFLAQILGDVLMSAIRKKWKFSTIGTYISSVAKGAWDGVWGGGVAREICKAMLVNILAQLIDIIRKGKSFDIVQLLTSTLDGILSYVIGKIVKVPRYIRDIKAKAQSQAIKGTKKLLKFLNNEIWKKLSFTLSLSGISNFITQFVEAVFQAVVNCAKEMYNGLKKDIGGLAIA